MAEGGFALKTFEFIVKCSAFSGLKMVRHANTLSEARALVKQTLGLGRLPVGTKEREVLR